MKIVPNRLISLQEQTFFTLSINVKNKKPTNINVHNEKGCIQMAARWLYIEYKSTLPYNIKTTENEFVGNIMDRYETIAALNTDPMCDWVKVGFSIEEKPVVIVGK